MGQGNNNWMNEPDVGSGVKPPAQDEIEREAQALGDQRRAQGAPGAPGEASSDQGRVLRSDGRLARVAVRRQDDGSYEAQVYVRLTREPEVAETYIPAGTFATEGEARAAAEERAERALRDEEF